MNIDTLSEHPKYRKLESLISWEEDEIIPSFELRKATNFKIPFEIISSIDKANNKKINSSYNKRRIVGDMINDIIKKPEIKYIKLPYQHMFLDFGKYGGFLLIDKKIKPNLYADRIITCINYTAGIDLLFSELPNDLEHEFLRRTNVIGIKEETKITFPVINGFDSPKKFDALFYENHNAGTCAQLVAIAKLLIIMNCHNTVIKHNHIDKKLQRARLKKGKKPLLEYKTIEIKLPKSKQKKNGKTTYPLLQNTTLHTVMGHMKEYTQDKPLFGKYTGMWWWPAHARGDKKYGEIKKDYKIRC